MGAAETARVAAPRGRPVDFEGAVAAAGLLKDRPPLPPGDGGRSDYLVQPMQMLSWYPRREPRPLKAPRGRTLLRCCCGTADDALTCGKETPLPIQGGLQWRAASCNCNVN